MGLLIAVWLPVTHGGSRRWINLGIFISSRRIAKLAWCRDVRYLREEPPKGGWGLRQMIIPFVLLGFPAALCSTTRPRHRTHPDPDHLDAYLRRRTQLAHDADAGLAAILAAPASWHYMKLTSAAPGQLINPQADPLARLSHHPERNRDRCGGRSAKISESTQARLNFLPSKH